MKQTSRKDEQQQKRRRRTRRTRGPTIIKSSTYEQEQGYIGARRSGNRIKGESGGSERFHPDSISQEDVHGYNSRRNGEVSEGSECSYPRLYQETYSACLLWIRVFPYYTQMGNSQECVGEQGRDVKIKVKEGCEPTGG